MSAAIAIKAARIFSPLEDRETKKYILVNRGIIEDISDSLPVDLSVSVFDFSGYVLTPFFCDYHLHFPQSTLGLSGRIAETLLQYGINRVFEGGEGDFSGIEMKEMLKDRLEIKTAGCAIYKKGGYGKHIGRAVEDFRGARALVDELYGNGTDYIKIVNSGIFDPETDSLTSGGFDREELVNIVSYARDCGLDVFCHVNGDKRIRAVAHAGVSAIIHGLHVSDETLSLMAEKKIAFIPTTNAFAGLLAVTEDEAARAHIIGAVEGHLSAIKDAADRGVKVLPGSDSGPHFLPYGRAYHEELALFRKAGLSDEYILASAVAGQFRTGMKADFLVLKGLNIEKVFLGGECLEKQ